MSCFGKLKDIEVRRCDRLENLFSFSIARRLQLLQSIDVSSCGNMKEIISIESEDESNSNINEVIDNIKLSQLRSLQLSSLPQLKSLEYKSNGSSTFFSGKVVLPNLEVLKLDEINVERIWQSSVAAMSSGIQNLTKLILKNCYNLKCLFSSSMIESFDRLQDLHIDNCPSLEEIMVIDDDDGLRKEERKNNVALSISNINFIVQMIVHRCNKLKTLFSRNIYKKFLRFKSLTVYDCDLLEVIFDFEDPDFEDKYSSVVIAQLSALDIYRLPKLKQVWNKDPKKFVSFEELKVVTIIGCDVMKTVFPAFIASSLSQLKGLVILSCKEIVSIVEEKEEINSKFVFPRLIDLLLSDLPKFRGFSSGRCTTERTNSSLFEKIGQQVNLLLPSSTTSFRNLTTLYVIRCNRLTNIITSSMAKSMGQLRKMSIRECNVITEVVLADEEDEAKDNEIVFTELKELDLFDLQSLTSFCSANYILKFPSLEELTVGECPEMKRFSRGKLCTPKLFEVQYSEYNEYSGDKQFEKCWKEDLNTTIEQLYEEMCERHGQMMIKLTNEEKEEVIEEEKVVSISSDVQFICSDNEELKTEHDYKEDVSDSNDVND